MDQITIWYRLARPDSYLL